MPDGIVWQEVDPTTGQLATAWCPARRRVPLLATSPLPGACDRHGATRVARGDVDDRPSGDERVDAADAPGPFERFGRRVRGWFEGVFR
jgi:hypothetical protein